MAKKGPGNKFTASAEQLGRAKALLSTPGAIALIARDWDVSPPVVHRELKAAGIDYSRIPRGDAAWKPARSYNPLSDEEIRTAIRMADEGATLEDFMQLWSVSKSTARTRLSSMGLLEVVLASSRQSLSERTQQILAEMRKGRRGSDVAREFGVTRQRINQIANWDKETARAITQRAIRLGKLVRPERCERCGKACKPQAHHPDYRKPLEIEWLCTVCHGSEHRGVDHGIQPSFV